MMDVFSKQSGAVEEESALDFEPYFKCNNSWWIFENPKLNSDANYVSFAKLAS